MNKLKHCIAAIGMTIAMMTPLSLLADDWDHSTKMTFSEPVEVPGHVLEPGAYWFNLADSEGNRNIVEIWNADRSQLITIILAISDYRLQPTDKTVVNFEERPTGAPEAIRAWFYPGCEYGQEFVYPKTRATELAKQTSAPVLSIRDEQPPQKQSEVKAVNPTGEDMDFTEVVELPPTTPPTVREAEATPPENALPHTGSSLPLIGLLGLAAFAGAGALRLMDARQRS